MFVDALTFGSLCTGIGGLDLGLERAGWRCCWQSEIDPYACRVLSKHWPDVPNLGDLKQIDWRSVSDVGLVCAGYPCQPFSIAGKRNGESDPRHLWPWIASGLRILRPRFILLENVPGHLSLGFGRVLGDLAELGYDAEWSCIGAADVGAPHLRKRLFVVAYPCGFGRERSRATRDLDCATSQAKQGVQPPLDGGGPNLADADGVGKLQSERVFSEVWRWLEHFRQSIGVQQWGIDPADSAESPVGRMVDGFPGRVDQLRCLGNAVVPQVAEFLGSIIIERTDHVPERGP